MGSNRKGSKGPARRGKRSEGRSKRLEGRTKGPRRDPAKERLWRKRLSEQKRSGLSVRAFCREAGVSESLFYQWRREISRRDEEARIAKGGSLRRDGESRSGKGDASRRKGIPVSGSAQAGQERGSASSRPTGVSRADSSRPTGVSRADSSQGGRGVSRPGATERGSADGPSASPPSRPAFIELCSTKDSSSGCDLLALTAPGAPAVEVVLRNGRVLRVGRGFDPDLVVELAAVLEGNGSC